MRTLGIDLAAQPAGTAACTLAWSAEGAVVVALRRDLDDDSLTELRRDAAMVAIDAPFAWPDALTEALQRWSGDRRWPQVTPQQLRYRVTDLEVQRVTGIWPLSPSADRIGVCAWRCARLLTAWGVRDLLGADGAVEGYPAAALRCWELPARGYKAQARQARARTLQTRGQLVAELRGRCPWLHLTASQWEACLGSHDTLDALLCALVARAAATGAVRPVPAEHAPAARREGWIALPAAGSLGRLG
ncbi:MAG TPA: DUF429 domain-containing protein [Solirubrobacteraceae bacterium]|nr:DUF429 domain-containing protein [Solirubrobacteraceae bacterium]